MKKLLKILSRLCIGIVCTVLALAVLVIGGLNIAKFIIYDDYFEIRTNICKNPGLGDGFVCQGLAADEDSGKFLISGYMDDKSNSRIYVTDKDDNSYHVKLTREGEKYSGHAGGVAVSHGTVYLANGGRIFHFPLSDVLNAADGDTVDIGEGTKVNNNASFVFSDEEHLYVGEFHHGENYKTEHHLEEFGVVYNAIITKYSLDDLTTPLKIYAVIDKVQGACFTPDGKIILSTSFSVADSVYYFYNEADAKLSESTLDGAPVYFLTEPTKVVKGPAMSEDMDYYDGKAICLTECASNKYKFGKLFFANKIYGLDVD